MTVFRFRARRHREHPAARCWPRRRRGAAGWCHGVACRRSARSGLQGDARPGRLNTSSPWCAVPGPGIVAVAILKARHAARADAAASVSLAAGLLACPSAAAAAWPGEGMAERAIPSLSSGRCGPGPGSATWTSCRATARSPDLGLALAVPGSPFACAGIWDPRSGVSAPFRGAGADDSTASSVAAARIVRGGGSRLQLLLHVKGTLIAVGGQPVQQVSCLVHCLG